jgi:hypothetical protein
MDATLKPVETDDPHDAPAIAPDIVPAAWADRVIADIESAAKSTPLEKSFEQQASFAAPTVDTTFRASIEERPTRKWPAGALMAVLLALCSGATAVAWPRYGETAKQMISNWTPRFAPAAAPSEQATPVVQADAATPQAAAEDQSSAQTAESTPTIASMARDLAGMGEQIERLKANIAELKAGQQVAARTSEAAPSETSRAEFKPAAIKAAIHSARPKTTSPAPPASRLAAIPARRPTPSYPQQAYPPAQAAASQPAPSAPIPAPASQPTSGSQVAIDAMDGPVVRPPMPLR